MFCDEIGASYYRGFDKYNDIGKVSVFLVDFLGFNHNIGYIISKTFKGAKFINYGLDASRTFKKAYDVAKVKGVYRLFVSYVTIFSEQILAYLFRKKTILRLTGHLLD